MTRDEGMSGPVDPSKAADDDSTPEPKRYSWLVRGFAIFMAVTLCAAYPLMWSALSGDFEVWALRIGGPVVAALFLYVGFTGRGPVWS